MKLSPVVAQRLAREMEGYFELELFEHALERARTLLAAGGFAVKARFFAAESLKMLDRFEEAMALYDELLESRPPAPYRKGALLGLGWCAKRLGRLREAIRWLEILCRRFPEEAIGPYNLACYYALDGRREEVLRLLRRAIRMESSYRDLARREEDFRAFREDPDFRRLLQETEE